MLVLDALASQGFHPIAEAELGISPPGEAKYLRDHENHIGRGAPSRVHRPASDSKHGFRLKPAALPPHTTTNNNRQRDALTRKNGPPSRNDFSDSKGCQCQRDRRSTTPSRGTKGRRGGDGTEGAK